MSETIPSDYILKQAPLAEVHKTLVTYRALAARGMTQFTLAIPKLEKRAKDLQAMDLISNEESVLSPYKTVGDRVVKTPK